MADNTAINCSKFAKIMDYTNDGHAKAFFNSYKDVFVFNKNAGWFRKWGNGQYIKIRESELSLTVKKFLRSRLYEAEMVTRDSLTLYKIKKLQVTGRRITAIKNILKKMYFTENSPTIIGEQKIKIYGVKYD